MTNTTSIISHPRGRVCTGCRQPLPTPSTPNTLVRNGFSLAYATCPNETCTTRGLEDMASHADTHECAGCFGYIEDGKQGMVTVTSRGHVRTVNSHDNTDCRLKADQNTRADRTWVRRPATRED